MAKKEQIIEGWKGKRSNGKDGKSKENLRLGILSRNNLKNLDLAGENDHCSLASWVKFLER